jgi:signal transduction histidine kinase
VRREDSALGERLDRARALAERTVQTVRNISLLLRPALLDDLGLAAIPMRRVFAPQRHRLRICRRSGGGRNSPTTPRPVSTA